MDLFLTVSEMNGDLCRKSQIFPTGGVPLVNFVTAVALKKTRHAPTYQTVERV